MTKMHRIMLPLLAAWLAGWMYLSWAAIQDDALIHLRYADNLFLHHFITYDGVHPDYGASSLLYVAILAFLRGLTASPDLPRAVSSVVHGLLFAGLAWGFCFRLPRQASVARLAAFVLLTLAVMPSAVRWLDDGMETGIAVCLVSLLAWLVHRQFVRSDEAISLGVYLATAALAFLAVMLRTELVLVCAAGTLILALRHRGAANGRILSWRALLHDSPLLLGGGLALCVILATMHVLLPDTAIAKSHGIGHWLSPLHDTAITLGGAFSFGLGMLAFWLLTLLLAVLQAGRLNAATALANAFFPMVLLLSSIRGQEIQGARYFAWTLFFSVEWNILELARLPESAVRRERTGRRGALWLAAFLVLLAVEAPVEIRAMHRVLTHRAQTMRSFESQRLDVLRERRGVASDIGYIGYFTDAKICDLAGLVNGRAAARLTSAERNARCARTDPEFVFGNASQIGSLIGLVNLSGWQVCGSYDFTNVRTLDTHLLAVRPEIAEEVCRATGERPEALGSLLRLGSQ
jgi:hypothetical protein